MGVPNDNTVFLDYENHEDGEMRITLKYDSFETMIEAIEKYVGDDTELYKIYLEPDDKECNAEDWEKLKDYVYNHKIVVLENYRSFSIGDRYWRGLYLHEITPTSSREEIEAWYNRARANDEAMYIKENVDFFGSELMKKVRDPAIESMMRIVDGNAKPPSWIKYFNVIKDCTDEQKDTIKKMLFEAIDSSLFYLMVLLDENPETFSLIINTEHGLSVAQEEEDELHGRLFYWFNDDSVYDYY